MERVQTCTLLGKCKVRSGRAEEECGRCAQEERGRGTQETLGARAEGACAVEGGFAVLVSVREDVTEGWRLLRCEHARGVRRAFAA